ncbi:major facilitator superfamily (MFS_1) transporter domain protein [Burkholderia pseudomallei]|nr:major facilitator superfamily (MFS_1) transporter domain protein [Burkholderia pseudomallei]KGW79241.1 major facilitator superfamily MFS_1 domain protein [Burkholderia pseudomallei MSHR2990]
MPDHARDEWKQARDQIADALNEAGERAGFGRA